MTARPTRASRRKAERGGRFAEWLAAMLLRLKGFSILTTRFRTGAGEIDIVAQRGGLVVFAEVKARSTVDAAIGSVTPYARHRIAAAAKVFLSRKRHLADKMIRYDIVAVAGWRIRHLPDAWRDMV